MNLEHLRRSLKVKWLKYYRENQAWISRLSVWVNTEGGQRRPSASFILGTLAAIEPQLNQFLPFITDLTGTPDRIITALGLDFNPDEQLEGLTKAEKPPVAESVKFLPNPAETAVKIPATRRTIESDRQEDRVIMGLR